MLIGEELKLEGFSTKSSHNHLLGKALQLSAL